jgi:hypothetical protein
VTITWNDPSAPNKITFTNASGHKLRKWEYRYRDRSSGNLLEERTLPPKAGGVIEDKDIPRDKNGNRSVDLIIGWAIDRQGVPSQQAMSGPIPP